MNLVDLSKEISYALRHAPWEYELELDEQGFVPMVQLLHALNESGTYEREVTQADLEQIIANSEKKRHEIVTDKIRALYGHTVPQIIKKEPGVQTCALPISISEMTRFGFATGCRRNVLRCNYLMQHSSPSLTLHPAKFQRFGGKDDNRLHPALQIGRAHV